MPNSYRIRTDVGTNKVLQVNLDQDYDKLEILSLSIFPNDVYTRSCADFGVICGRVFANKGLGLVNARVSIFIPISEEDELNPVISTLYPYKSFEDFNEDGYKYNLLPYTQSYSGHVPVGTFPDRIDALTNPSVIEVYDKYYKFTAKTNDAGDFMIFGIPVGQYQIFMQVDLSDIGEFSLAPQDLIRMGRAVESQVNGTKFKFSENYSELPQIVTLTKTIQVAPFYGEEGICQHYIVRADFDLTSEAAIELKPTAIFMGSLISTANKKKLKRNCKIPSKQGWLCDMIAGPGQIECIRQTIFTDNDGRPILEEHRLENDGKLIDENGAWVVDIPMNLDYTYTDENGIRRISPDGSAGVPIRARYRFKVKWQQSTSLREENRRGYFLVPNIKEWGWSSTPNNNDPNTDPAKSSPLEGQIPLNDADGVENISSLSQYYVVTGVDNVSEWTVSVNGIVRPDLHDTIPMGILSGQLVEISFVRQDSSINGYLFVDVFNTQQFQTQCSYAYSLSWADYGTTDMVQEAVNCEDRFFEFSYNKVYTVSQLIDRYSTSFVPQKSIQIKYVNDDSCEGEKNPFPVNDAYYRYSILFILFSFILEMFKFIFIPLTIILHVLALLWPILLAIILVFIVILNVVIAICTVINEIIRAIASLWGGEGPGSCPEFIPINFSQLRINPFKNIKLPLFLYTEDGCIRCRCNIDDVDLDETQNPVANQLLENAQQFSEGNVSFLANLTTSNDFLFKNAKTINNNDMGGPSNYNLGGTCTYINYNNNDWPNSTHSFSRDVITSSSSQQTKDIAKILQVGWNSDENLDWVRLPIFEGSDGVTNFQRYTLSLTCAEKLNLFNTKAKYFDNVTDLWGPNNPNRKNESISPGNVGWNQIRVTWEPDYNNPDTKFHYDNVIVLLVDNTGFTSGDILTFQDPSQSEDPNVEDSLGVFTPRNLVTVKYANPDFISGPPNNVTTYVLPTNELETITGTTCFPMDIEYFQVIKTIPYSHYFHGTRINTPSDTKYSVLEFREDTAERKRISDMKFSLPYRFLRSDAYQYRYKGHCNGCDGITGAGPSGWPISKEMSAAAMSNANRVYTTRRVNGPAFGFECVNMCFDHITFTSGHLDDWRGFTYTGETGTVDDYKTNLRVVFLQRGVDPNSQTIKVKYDLRRLFGSSTPWSDNVPKRAGWTQTFEPLGGFGVTDFVGDYIIFTNDNMKMNIPIQGKDNDLTDPKGLRLPYHEFFLNNSDTGVPANSLPIYYRGYNFEYLDSVDSPYNPFFTTMPTYYSALSKYSRYLHGQWNAGTTVVSNIIDTNLDVFGGNGLYNGITCVSPFSAWASNLTREFRLEFIFPCYLDSSLYITSPSNRKAAVERFPFSIPSRYTIYPYYNYSNGWVDGSAPGRNCGNEFQGWGSEAAGEFTRFNTCHDGVSTYYAGSYSNATSLPGCGNNATNNNYFCGGGTSRDCTVYGGYSDSDVWYHSKYLNTETNDVSGYFGREYVEGSSVFLGKLTTEWDYAAAANRGCPLGFNNNGITFWSDYFYYDYPGNYNTSNGSFPHAVRGSEVGVSPFGYTYLRQRDHYFRTNEAIYFSPVYAGFLENVPVDPSGYNANTWHVDPNHAVEMTDKRFNVFRSDRLPSSTQITNRGNGNTMILHQNPGFTIFKLSACTVTPAGGGDVQLDPISVEVDIDFLPGGDGGVYADVLNSLTSCEEAVDLNSYYIDSNNNPAIQEPNPYSTKPAAGADYLWFQRKTGCYNLVSKPFVSLFPLTVAEEDLPNQAKKYSDIRSIVEWVQRLKLTFAMCFDIFSQTFSNNWINGTLYAFPFQMATFFDSDNQPFKEYCKDTIFFNRQIKNFFYRSSPYNGSNFVGKLRYNLDDSSVNKYGNLRNLLFPTTVMDLGPKNQFIQELVNSNDYDGYIVNKVPSTTYQDVSNVTNLFVLSRFVNASFWQLLFPVGNTDDNGNTEGSDDPAIGALFKNSRWQNGELFAGGLLPGVIDADFSQMISINSEFGVKEYGPELYGNNTIYFGTDGTGVPVFGLYYSAETQDRDYLSPRRTIYTPNATLPFTNADVENITTFTQVVPSYQWQINMANAISNTPVSTTIFGQQSNNFVTNPGGPFFSYEYQKLDRTNPTSDYFRPSSNIITGQYYNAFISNFDNSGNFIPNAPIPLGDRRYTFASPYQFYFGLVAGGTAMDVFITKYVDTTLVDE